MLADAKELYTSVETYASVLIKEDLAMHARASNQRQCMAEELEAKLQEREGLDDLKLEHELESLASRESTLASREASLEAERKNLEDARLKVFSHELTTEVHEASLRS
jgi:hypothetical protein